MKELDQQIALCEWTGWTSIENFSDQGMAYYCNTSSLDVLHEMEKRLDYEDWGFFIQFLGEVVQRNQHLKWITPYNYVSANASQRREALLRTLGLWKE